MKAYRYPSRLFRKEWHWFEDPHEIHGVDMLNFFSYNDSIASGFSKKKGLTTVIDLSKPEEVLWEALRKKYLREQIEKGKRAGISIRGDVPWKELVSIYRRFRKGKAIAADDPRIFEHCRVYAAELDGKFLSMGAFIEDDKHSRALALASERFSANGKQRELIGQANRMLIWEALRDARSRGILHFDLGGIEPDSADPGDRSLAEFKEAFGGTRQLGYYYHKVNSRLLLSIIKARRALHI